MHEIKLQNKHLLSHVTENLKGSKVTQQCSGTIQFTTNAISSHFFTRKTGPIYIQKL